MSYAAHQEQQAPVKAKARNYLIKSTIRNYYRVFINSSRSR